MNITDTKIIIKGFFSELFKYSLILPFNWPSNKSFGLVIRIDKHTKKLKFFSTADQQKEYINYMLKKYGYTNHEVFVEIWKYSYLPIHVRDIFVN